MKFLVDNLLKFLKMNLLGCILVVLSVVIYVLLDTYELSSFTLIVIETVAIILFFLIISFKRKYLVFTKKNIKQSILSVFYMLFTSWWMAYANVILIVVVYTWGKIGYDTQLIKF